MLTDRSSSVTRSDQGRSFQGYIGGCPLKIELCVTTLYFIWADLEKLMKSVTPTELSKNLDLLLDEILKTGIPLEIDRGGERLRIIPVEKVDKLKNLVHRPDVILGDADDLIDLNWEQEVNLDLP